MTDTPTGSAPDDQGQPAGLIERLEAAEVGSRELDRELMALTYRWEQRHIGATCWDDYHGTCCPEAKHLDWVWIDPVDGAWKTNAKDGYEFTTSLDAALALAERVLPGKGWGALYSGLMNWRAHTPTGLQRLPLLVCAAIAKATGEPL